MQQAIVLGLVQGATEFLPISSSGHLVLLQSLLRTDLGATFDIVVHFGTLLATLVFFRKQIANLTKKALINLAIGSLPAIALGLVLKNTVDTLFSSTAITAIGLAITTILLITTKRVHNQGKRNVQGRQALGIGIAQAIAIIPGISRSGATLATALNLRVKQDEAFTFSFLLSIPAIAGATLIGLKDVVWQPSEVPQYILGLIAAAVTGYIALRLLERILKQAKLYRFAYYTAALAALAFAL